jgi:transcription elongation factor GreA
VPSTYLTLSGFEKLQSELDYLRKVKRSEIAALLQDSNGWEKSDGESESEFDMAKNQQAFIEGRILELESLLSNPSIIDDHFHGDFIDIGSRVKIVENDEEPVSYTIVGPAEASPTNGLISYASPLGSALIGHRPGEEVIVRAPGGIYKVQILVVS